jgi:hypothetical protein
MTLSFVAVMERDDAAPPSLLRRDPGCLRVDGGRVASATFMEMQWRGIYVLRIGETMKRFYVGSTAISFKSRWSDHIDRLTRGENRVPDLQREWNKAASTFQFCIVELCEPSQRQAAEQRWINVIRREGGSLFNKNAAHSATQDQYVGPVFSEDELITLSELLVENLSTC